MKSFLRTSGICLGLFYSVTFLQAESSTLIAITATEADFTPNARVPIQEAVANEPLVTPTSLTIAGGSDSDITTQPGFTDNDLTLGSSSDPVIVLKRTPSDTNKVMRLWFTPDESHVISSGVITIQFDFLISNDSNAVLSVHARSTPAENVISTLGIKTNDNLTISTRNNEGPVNTALPSPTTPGPHKVIWKIDYNNNLVSIQINEEPVTEVELTSPQPFASMDLAISSSASSNLTFAFDNFIVTHELN